MGVESVVGHQLALMLLCLQLNRSQQPRVPQGPLLGRPAVDLNHLQDPALRLLFNPSEALGNWHGSSPYSGAKMHEATFQSPVSR